MRRVAVLGGGMSALSTAWRLSEPEHRGDVEVTVYQQGWLLGGKGASVRGMHGRIEEHGLHVWLGYYDNAFRLMREVYADLDRPGTDPDCPIRGWRDAFSPVDRVGMHDGSAGSAPHWQATFSRRHDEPGLGKGGPLEVTDVVRRGLMLLLDLAGSLPATGSEPAPALVLSPSPWHPAVRGQRSPGGPDADLDLGVVLEVTEVLRALRSGRAPGEVLSRSLGERIVGLAAAVAAGLPAPERVRRTTEVIALVATCVAGALRDGLLTDPAGFAAIDDLDFRGWLRRHGATPQVADSPLIRAMYDLAFAYEDGDPGRPAMSAGLGLFLAGKLFFEYSGSIVWRMEAGMGEAVVAPLYQALSARGVRFRFFHQVQALHVDSAGDGIGAVTVVEEASLAPGVSEYQPLVRLHGLPCFPSEPRWEQLSAPDGLEGDAPPARAGARRLQAGVDFDELVLTLPPAVSRLVAEELVDRSAPWRAMVDHVASVPTQSVQLWLREPMASLGWDERCFVATGYAKPFESFAAMSHLLAREDWPSDAPVAALGYFCSVLPVSAAASAAQGDPARRAGDAEAARDAVRENVMRLLSGQVGRFWPEAVTDGEGFAWDLLWAPQGHAGSQRLEWQYWRANVDPSDLYVQSLPGTSAHRLRPDGSGFHNLYLAGDWVDSGLNAGCIEAAVMGGLEAANAVLGRPVMHDILGEWYGLAAE